ncbi:Protein of unknown function [Cotesia congregata]|uniref:Uncharacterized protein n=1 Tax=Cotesia congregata TaxID=51543 RepID=A0A8J2H430_COTCN|nr:Protein of unknown function [Cotesia congregata]
MESERPDMIEKAKGLSCLAPVAFLGHVEWPTPSVFVLRLRRSTRSLAAHTTHSPACSLRLTHRVT